jgi:cell division protease FtsH
MEETRQLLSTHRDKLDALTTELIEKETLDDAQIRILLGFEAIDDFQGEPSTNEEASPGTQEEPIHE